jgi:hypothetical protein
MLDPRHVLTCAHVMGEEDEIAEVQSAVGYQEWKISARVAPGSWVHRDKDTRRGDVALLKLDESAPSGVHTRLWCAPLSRGRIRAFGYPRAAPHGIPADAELGGDGGRGGELGLLKPLASDGQWIEPGFSGAGVVVLDGDHAGHVIGIIVADFRNVDARAAWMMPTETIRHYLPDIAPWVAGEPADRLGPSDDGLPVLSRSDTLRVALTQELRRLLADGWAGTVVIPGGSTATGTSWLVRLVRTADPATRARTSDPDFTGAPPGTTLELGAIDAAYDASGKSVDKVTRYLAERFGLPPGGPDLVGRLLRRDPPISLVIANVDRAESPGTLIRELVRPLAAGARLHGARLVLGFAGPLPAALPYEVSLDHGPLTGNPVRSVTGAAADAHVAELATAENRAAVLNAKNERRFRKCPTLPPVRAPRLRIRLAVARAGGPSAEFAVIDGEAVTALGELESFTSRSERLDDELKELRGRLQANRVRVERYFGAEDSQLGDLHDRAFGALYQARVNFASARGLMDTYLAEADRRIRDREQEGRA